MADALPVPNVHGLGEMAGRRHAEMAGVREKRRTHMAVLQQAIRENQLAIAQNRNALELASSVARVALQAEAAKHRTSSMAALVGIVTDETADQRAKAAASKELIRLDAAEFKHSDAAIARTANIQVNNLFRLMPDEVAKYAALEGTEDAVEIPSATEMDVCKETGDGGTVGEGNAEREESAGTNTTEGPGAETPEE